MESDAKEVQPTFDTKPAEDDTKERRDSTASSDNSSGTDVDANQGPISYTLSHLSASSREILSLAPTAQRHSSHLCD